MAAYDSLKSLVQQAIRTNGNNEITGQVLQNVLMAMIDELGGENGYAGVATPSTNPGAPDGKVFYFATEAGTYTHFDGATLAKGIHLLVFNGVTWSHQTLYTIDSEVTSGSNNLITSGAVYTKIINAINALDATVSKSAGADGLSLSLTEIDGKVTNISGSIAPQTYDAYGAAGAAQIAAATDATNKVNAAKTQILGDAASDYNTLGKLEDKIQAEASRAAAAESALNTAKANKATTLAGYGINDAYTKTEVNGLVSTPHQNYVTVPTYASLPATGSADTIYRVSNYNGSTSQVDASVYSEYAWNGSGYTFLRVVSQIGEVFDITVYNSNTKYADLAAALGTNGANVPSSIRRGGMSVKFVQSSDNKYVQYRLMATSFSTTESDWQGVDDEPEVNSDNLVKSGGVKENENNTLRKLYSQLIIQLLGNDFEQGNIDNSGNTYATNGVIRSKELIPTTIKTYYNMQEIVANSHKWTIAFYNSDGTFALRRSFTSYKTFIPSYPYFKLLINNADGSDIFPTDIDGIRILGEIPYFDSSIHSNIILDNTILEQGSIDNSGNTYATNGVIRTNDFIKVTTGIPYKFDDATIKNRKFCIVKYNADGTFVSRGSFDEVSKEFVPTYPLIKILIANISGDIAPSDINGILMHDYNYIINKIDTLPLVDIFINDLVLKNGYYLVDNGNYYNTQNNVAVETYIKGNKVYSLENIGDFKTEIVFYNGTTKQFAGTNWFTNKTFVDARGYDYIRLAFRTANITDIQNANIKLKELSAKVYDDVMQISNKLDRDVVNEASNVQVNGNLSFGRLLNNFHNSISMTNEIDDYLVSLQENGDKMCHVPTMSILDGVAYIVYNFNQDSTSESTSHGGMRLRVQPVSDLLVGGNSYQLYTICNREETEYIKLSDNTQIEAHAWDVFPMVFDSKIYLVGACYASNECYLARRIFNPSNNSFGDWECCKLKVGENYMDFSSTNLVANYPNIGNLGNQFQCGLRWALYNNEYYAGIGATNNTRGVVVKTSDFENVEVVLIPEIDACQFEIAVEFMSTFMYLAIRRPLYTQSIYLQKYNMSNMKLVDSMLITDAIPNIYYSNISRPVFFKYYNELYLAHNVYSRGNADIVKVDAYNIHNSMSLQQFIGTTYPFNNFCFAIENDDIFVASTTNQSNPVGDNSIPLAIVAQIHLSKYTQKQTFDKFKSLLLT